MREIARETGLAVNMPVYTPRPPKAGKLDPFKGYLRQRVRSAHPSWIPATVLGREIAQQGYSGCVKAVATFVRKLKPARKEDPVIRFETEPGKQMQVDWIEFKRRFSGI